MSQLVVWNEMNGTRTGRPTNASEVETAGIEEAQSGCSKKKEKRQKRTYIYIKCFGSGYNEMEYPPLNAQPRRMKRKMLCPSSRGALSLLQPNAHPPARQTGPGNICWRTLMALSYHFFLFGFVFFLLSLSLNSLPRIHVESKWLEATTNRQLSIIPESD